MDLETGEKLFHTFTIAGNRTLGFPINFPNPGISFYVKVTQDATGGRELDFASGYVFSRGQKPVISELPDAETLLCVVILANDRAVVFPVGQEFAA